MSPEQAAGDECRARLRRLLARPHPLRALGRLQPASARISPAATARAIGEPVESLAEARPELPAALCAAIDACLEPDPDDRPELADLREAPDRGPRRPAPRSRRAAPGRGARRRHPAARRPGAALRDPARAPAPSPCSARSPASRGWRSSLAALLAPAALDPRPHPRLAPAGRSRPLLGLIGAAPAFLAVAARRERADDAGRDRRPRLDLDRRRRRPARPRPRRPGRTRPGSPAGWAASGPTAIDQLLSPLLTPTAIAVGLTWIGGAVLLGPAARRRVARPAPPSGA